MAADCFSEMTRYDVPCSEALHLRARLRANVSAELFGRTFPLARDVNFQLLPCLIAAYGANQSLNMERPVCFVTGPDII